MINLFKHLLPRSKTWSITIDKQLREFFEAMAGAVDDARTYFEDIWLDLFPSTTRELTAWEQQFAVDRSTFSDGERRTQLDGLWTATGGQSPKYFRTPYALQDMTCMCTNGGCPDRIRQSLVIPAQFSDSHFLVAVTRPWNAAKLSPSAEMAGQQLNNSGTRW
jgi:hypothetical protein